MRSRRAAGRWWRGRREVQHVGAAALDRVGGGLGRGGRGSAEVGVGQRLLVGDLRLGGLLRVLVGGVGGERPVGGVRGLLERGEARLGGVESGAHSAGRLDVVPLPARGRGRACRRPRRGRRRRRRRARRECFRIDVPTIATAGRDGGLLLLRRRSCVPPCDDDRKVELAAAALGTRHSLGDPAVDLAEQLLDEAVLRHAPQHRAVRVDVAGVAAAGDAEVGVARLARPVHGAAHDGDLEVLAVGLQAALDGLGELVHLDVRAAARRARDQLRARTGAGRAPSGSRSRRAPPRPGSVESETRIVSPMPCASSEPMPIDDLTAPVTSVPASVTPRCSG